MKVASVIFREKDFTEITQSQRPLEKIQTWLELCQKEKIQLVLFPALLGNLFEPGKPSSMGCYIGELKNLSIQYKELLICPGSFWEQSEGKLYHSSCLLKQGEILLWQRQLYLAKWEQKAGLERGVDLSLIDYNGFKIGILLSTDAFYPQVARALALNGADLVLTPLALKGPENLPLQLSGLWSKVQQNLFFALESGFKGSYIGNKFFSNSAIHAPLAMTKKEDGFLARENYEILATNSTFLIAALDKESRATAIKKFNPLDQLNIDFYKDVF